MAARRPRSPRLAPQERRTQLLDCALDVLTESGFGHVTIEAIARRAGVTRPVVYDLFGDLESLLVALIDRADAAAHATMHGLVLGDPPDGIDPDRFLVDSVLRFLRAVRADPRTWRLVLMPPPGNSPELRRRIDLARHEIAERVAALLDWGVSTRGGPAGLDLAVSARMIVAIGEDAARLMLAHPRRFTPERLAEVAEALVALLPPEATAGGLLAVPVVPPPPRAVAPPSGAAPPGSPPEEIAPEPSAPRRRMPRSQRREQLLDVALAILAQEGFAALSMEAVARRAGVNRVVVYRSFPNLAGLLAALMVREDRRVRQTLRALIPPDPEQRPAAQLLLSAQASLLGAVAERPDTWRVSLLRPESAPRALQKIVNRRRASVARRLEPLVRFAIDDLRADAPGYVVEAIARMLLTIGEEQARLALDDPVFPPRRLLAATGALLEIVFRPAMAEGGVA